MHKTLLSLALIFVSGLIFAGNFTAGIIVILRVGSGVHALSNASDSVFLDEYTVGGTLVQTISVPAAVSGSNHALTLSGSAATEGELNLSPNGQYLTFVGFDTVTGYANVSTGITNRTIARVNASGTVNTSTGFIAGSAFAAGNFRSAVTNDGNEFWASGSGGGSGSTGGIWYQPFGSFTASATQSSSTILSVRDVNIFGGQLYLTSSGAGVYKDGTGLPTTGGQTETMLPGLPTADSAASPFSFVFLDESTAVSGLDVLYIADNGAGGIYKYSLVGGSWVSNGNIASTNGLTGLTGFYSCHGATLYASGPSGVWTLTDASGYNATITGSYNQLVVGAANTLIHGIAFTPGTIVPTPPVVTIASDTNIKCFGANDGSIITSLTGGAGTVTYNWGGGITSANRSGLAPGTYNVTVTDALGCTSTAGTTLSQPASALTLTSDSITNLPCTGGTTGAIKITMMGGTGSYHYDWTPGSITTQDISNLGVGLYHVTVTDSFGCTFKDSFNISQSGSLAFSDTVTAPSCYGAANGSIGIHVTGGTPGYNYRWSANNDTTTDIAQIGAGSYTVTITDHNGCTLIENVPVTAPDSISIVLATADPTTFGGTNGKISATVSGGTPGYTYSWTGASGSADSITNLAAGPYCLIVSDSHACADTACATLSQPSGINEASWMENFTAYTGSSNINIQLTLKETTNVSIELYDLTGRRIFSTQQSFQSHLNLQIPDAGITAGSYIVRAATELGSISKKIVVIK